MDAPQQQVVSPQPATHTVAVMRRPLLSDAAARYGPPSIFRLALDSFALIRTRWRRRTR